MKYTQGWKNTQFIENKNYNNSYIKKNQVHARASTESVKRIATSLLYPACDYQKISWEFCLFVCLFIYLLSDRQYKHIVKLEKKFHAA